MKSEQDQLQMLIQIAHQCSVTTDMLHEWLQEQLIPLRDNQWDDEAIETVRRIRRLTALGVNTPGIEIVLHMRQELLRFSQEMQQAQQRQDELRSRYEREISQLLRQLSLDV